MSTLDISNTKLLYTSSGISPSINVLGLLDKDSFVFNLIVFNVNDTLGNSFSFTTIVPTYFFFLYFIIYL